MQVEQRRHAVLMLSASPFPNATESRKPSHFIRPWAFMRVSRLQPAVWCQDGVTLS